jgi:tetratricopeptide (TPR) repeat protein
LISARPAGRKEYNRGVRSSIFKSSGRPRLRDSLSAQQALPFSRDQLTTDATVAPIGAFENFIKARSREIAMLASVSSIAQSKSTPRRQRAGISLAIFEAWRIRFEAMEYKEALEQLSLVDEKNPRYDEAQFYVGVAQDALGQTEQALTTLKKLAARLPLFEGLQQHRRAFDKAEALQGRDRPSEAGHGSCAARH